MGFKLSSYLIMYDIILNHYGKYEYYYTQEMPNLPSSIGTKSSRTSPSFMQSDMKYMELSTGSKCQHNKIHKSKYFSVRSRFIHLLIFLF